MLRIIFGLLAALLFSTPAQAAIPAAQGYNYNIPGHSSGPDLAATMTGWASARGFVWTGCGTWSNNTTQCTFTNNGDPISPQQVTRSPTGLTCPANSTLSGSLCNCNSGFEESGQMCQPANPACEIGKGHTFNYTVGWARSGKPDADDMLGPMAAPPSSYGYNDGACVGNVVSLDDCWRSSVPTAQGLYRLSCDYTMVVTGSSQSAGDSNSDPSTPDATCPGFVGEVNGQTVCVGTASNPLPDASPAPDAPTKAGNPSAGAKPSTGEGSGTDGAGRTPTAGSGGNAGGPATAAVGPGGTGKRGETGKDGTAVCGAAPLPSCSVKVDETGVPAEGTAEGKFTQAGTDLDKVKTDADAAFNNQKDLTLPAWTWTFSMPTGCTPLVLAAYDDFVIDVCQWQPIIHDLMSLLWIGAGIFGLIALFRNASGV